MGRLGPLTSQALGRSPYDDVVFGEGEGDPHAPLQMYDERGRPVNPETRRINKEVIRSHNEVMQVIGVAEPENSMEELRTENRRRREHDLRDERVGRTLTNIGRALEIGGVWGVNGLRQRILLYREYAHVPFMQLFSYERARRSPATLLLTGLPAFALNHLLKGVNATYPPLRKNSFVRTAFTYIRMHLQLWVFMQRMELVPATTWIPTSWVPGLRFFIPFSSSSPIPPCPPLTSFTSRAVITWLGGVALSVAPIAAFWVYSKLWMHVTRTIWLKIYKFMPTPSNTWAKMISHPPPSIPRIPVNENAAEAVPPAPQDSMPFTPPPTTPAPAPTPAPMGEEESRQRARNEAEAAAAILALADRPQPSEPPHAPVGAVRRQSTFSNRGVGGVGGDDYISEDEETEVVSATLISFDVEATEATDTPPGVWSAELRPNLGSDARPARDEHPVYRDNNLTRLPSMIATDILTVVSSYVVAAPYEAFALRFLARSFQAHRGLSVDNIYMLLPIGSEGFSWTAFTNFLGLEFVHLMLEADFWAAMTMVAASYQITREDWDEQQQAKEDAEMLLGERVLGRQQ